MNEIKSNGNEIIRDNNFLIVAFQNRLLCRMLKIFGKYNIPFNKNIINKSIDEYLINNMVETNEEIIDKYIELLKKYEKIMQGYVTRKIDTEIIKKATSAFVEKISKKNMPMQEYHLYQLMEISIPKMLSSTGILVNGIVSFLLH